MDRAQAPWVQPPGFRTAKVRGGGTGPTAARQVNLDKRTPPREPSGLLGAKSTTLFQIPDLGSFAPDGAAKAKKAAQVRRVALPEPRGCFRKIGERRLDKPGSVRLVVQHLGRPELDWLERSIRELLNARTSALTSA